MRGLWAGLLAGWLAVLPARGTEVAAAERAAIEAAIRGQIAAFARDDAEGAYAFASETVRAQFASPTIFLRMVAVAYAPIHRAQAIAFRAPEEAEGRLRQPAVVTGPDGRRHLALYELERGADGAPRIAAVRLLVLPAEGS